ncbi:MAG: intradiol ring-cleavage dioxygenase [Desulfuromonas sp.]|nr:MAG: intradiol ring-cleavage dioxygenase [Desulfuromonas sp.]
MILLFLSGPLVASATETFRCQPTRPDADGPFYRADAPERHKIGEGYLLTGAVKSAADCSIIPGAKIEIWMNGPDGRYGDEWRATLFADPEGKYRFESHLPVAYGSRPPHIHIIVNMPGYRELITQHYPKKKSKKATFDLVLIPE